LNVVAGQLFNAKLVQETSFCRRGHELGWSEFVPEAINTEKRWALFRRERYPDAMSFNTVTSLCQPAAATATQRL